MAITNFVIFGCAAFSTHQRVPNNMSHHDLISNAPTIGVPKEWHKRHPSKPNLQSFEEYEKLYHQSITDPTAFFGQQARKELSWFKDFQTVKYPPQGFNTSWFLEGELNACYNCVDRHAIANPDKPAIIYEPDEPSLSLLDPTAKKTQIITYGELLSKVCQLAQVLTSLGVKKGDTVAVYLPMIPEAIITILAIVRIGAIHSVVFAGFSSSALRDRINDAKSKLVITTDQSKRGGKTIETKRIVDEALTQTGDTVKNVIVVKRTGNEMAPFDASRGDLWYHDEINKFKPYCPATPVNAEDILFLLYTSGSTGKPKGLIHSTAGYLLHALLTAKYVFDMNPNDTVFTAADIGWVAGHTYVCYAPLLVGATTVVYEGTPTYPHPGRFWDIVDAHRCNIFYIAPTALRLLKRAGDQHVKKYDLLSLRSLGVVGEPCAPEVWEWYYSVVGRERCTVQDTFWQTENGGPMIAACAGATEMKPGSVSLPFFGVDLAILDPVTGKEIGPAAGAAGAADDNDDNDNDNAAGSGIIQGVLAFKQPFPSLTRGIWGDHQRYLETYFKPYPGYFFTGDGAAIEVNGDNKGFVWILGRVDDVVNVSGHRLSTAEIEGVILEHGLVAENAVVGYNHSLMGQAIAAFVSLREDLKLASDGQKQNAQDRKQWLNDVKTTLRLTVRKEIGPFAAPKVIFIVDDLPKTRSGKIMRRILRKVLNGEEKELGDISTLSNPDAVQSLIEIVNRDLSFRD